MRNQLLRLLIAFFVTVLQANSQQSLVLTDEASQYSASQYIWFFKDKEDKVSFEEVLSGKYDSAFQLNTKAVPNFGNQIATYWNKFSIVNNSSIDKRWLLVIDEHHLDEIDFFYPGDFGNYFKVPNGRSIPYNDRGYSYNNYVFDMPLKPGDTSVFYLRIHSHLIIYPVVITQYEKFIENSQERNIAKGIIVGFFLMIILYNFFIYLSANDKNYLYYTAYACINIIMICDLTGYLDFLWQGPLSFMNDKTPAIIAIDGIFLMLFTKHILEFKTYFPFANKVIHYFLIPVACWTITANIFGYLLAASITNQFWVLALVIFLYYAAIVVYRKHYLPARFYIIACGSFFIACAIYAATLLGFIPVNTFTNHVIEIGSALEILLFSFALADKIRQLRKDRSKAQTQLVDSLRENEQLILDQNRILEIKVNERTKDLSIEKEKSEKLLLNILPQDVAEELMETGRSEAKQFDNVSIMFIEFADFTRITERLAANELVSEIDKCFKAFDKIIEKYGLEKIKTFGGAYLVVAGLPRNDEASAINIAKASIDIRNFMNQYKEAGGIFEARIGIHTGSVIAGIVGSKKFAFDIWGDVVNTAARMQQSSTPGNINVSGYTYEKINSSFNCNYRGKVSAKNKGEVDMYFVENYKNELEYQA